MSGSQLSESAIVRAVAEGAAKRLAKRAIATLQRMASKASGDDSALETAWDEICAQLQGEQSYFWEAYDNTVGSVVARDLPALPLHERQAVWLQTQAGESWLLDPPEGRDPDPVMADDIIGHVANEYIYAEAERWSNARIRTHLNRGE